MQIKPMPNPETIKDKREISDIILYLEEFETLNGVPGAVVERQNLSLGVSYTIIPRSVAEKDLQKWHGREIYLRFWPKEYFLNL